MVTVKRLFFSFRRSTTAVKRWIPLIRLRATLTRLPATRIVAATTGSLRWVTTWIVNRRRLAQLLPAEVPTRLGALVVLGAEETVPRHWALLPQSDVVAGRTVMWKMPLLSVVWL